MRHFTTIDDIKIVLTDDQILFIAEVIGECGIGTAYMQLRSVIGDIDTITGGRIIRIIKNYFNI